MTKLKRSKSPQRILAERLRLANLKPRAWAVALVLEGYARLERGTGKRVASLYHDKIAAETGMSVGNVRRALMELTTGPCPLYRKRNATGRQHTIFGNNDWELTTTGAVYEWIGGVPDGVGPAPSMPTTPTRTGRRGHKPTPRCLTPAQVEQFASDLEADPSYGEMLPEGQKRIAEYHALSRHVDDEWCPHCQVAVAREIATQFPERFEGVRLDELCPCGAPVVRNDGRVFDLWDYTVGDTDGGHQCDATGRESEPQEGEQG